MVMQTQESMRPGPQRQGPWGPNRGFPQLRDHEERRHVVINGTAVVLLTRDQLEKCFRDKLRDWAFELCRVLQLNETVPCHRDIQINWILDKQEDLLSRQGGVQYKAAAAGGLAGTGRMEQLGSAPVSPDRMMPEVRRQIVGNTDEIGLLRNANERRIGRSPSPVNRCLTDVTAYDVRGAQLRGPMDNNPFPAARRGGPAGYPPNYAPRLP